MYILLTESQGLLLSLAMSQELNKDMKFRFSVPEEHTTAPDFVWKWLGLY